jgi:hypothetical protein
VTGVVAVRAMSLHAAHYADAAFDTIAAGGPPPMSVPLGRVLVVDDEPLLTAGLDEALTDFGYLVEAATNGAEALALMPVLAGSKIPVIAISGYVSGPMEGFFAFFKKPIRYPLLLGAIASAVGRDA